MQEDKVLAQHERLVQMLASKYHQLYNQRYDLDDFAQAARIGILEAVRTYDPDSGNKFITHAYNKAKFSIGRMLRRDTGVIKIPTKVARAAVVPKRVSLPDDCEPSQRVSMDFSNLYDRVILDEAIATLPPRQRAVIQGLYFDHRSAVDIAAELNCATNTIYVTAQRAMAKLRTYFSEREIEV